MGDPFSDDTLREECGIVGICRDTDAAAVAALALHALQHRGQEAAGIVSTDGEHFFVERHPGLVGDNFSGQDEGSAIRALKGALAIGHVRYSTAGGSERRNIQPLFADIVGGSVALAHNGNLTNALKLRAELVERGAIFQSTADTEVILHLMAMSGEGDMVTRLIDALRQVEGAYSLVVMTRSKLIGVRDPLGVRPLILGKRDGAHILVSETCALDIVGAHYVRDVAPGEMVVIGPDGVKSIRPFLQQRQRFCIFEYIYFSRPDSIIAGLDVYEARKRIGAELARESPVAADVVVPVPDSGVPAALGFAQAAGLNFELGIIRSHYVGRTFIEPTDRIRNLGVRLKHNANRVVLQGKRVVLVDDSIVRGTTSRKIIEMVRDAGASEVHMRIASPPTTNSCFYGVDTPDKEKLLAHRMSVAEMRGEIRADSLAFISIDGLYRALGEAGRNKAAPQYCDACFTGEYPTRLTDEQDRESTEPRRQLSLLVTS